MNGIMTKRRRTTSQRTFIRVDKDVEVVVSCNMPENTSGSFAIPSDKMIEQSRKTYSKINPLTFVQRTISKDKLIDDKKHISSVKKLKTSPDVPKTRSRVSINIQKNPAITQKVKRERKAKCVQTPNKKKLLMTNGLVSSNNSFKSKNIVREDDEILYDFPKSKVMNKTLKSSIIKKEVDHIEVKTDISFKRCQPNTSKSSQFSVPCYQDLEFNKTNYLDSNGLGKKFDLRRVKKEHITDGPINSFYESDKEVIVINEADTAPVFQASGMFHNSLNCETAQDSFKLSPSIKCVPSKASTSKLVTNLNIDQNRCRNKEIEGSDSSKTASKPAKRKLRCREIDALYKNLNEISWAQDSSFKSLLICDNQQRHSERVSANTFKLRRQKKPDEVKKVSISRTVITKKRKPNFSFHIKKNQADINKAAKMIPLKSADKKVSSGKMLKNHTNEIKKFGPTKTLLSHVNKVREVITLSDDSEAASPEPKTSKTKSVPFQPETSPEIVHCSTSADKGKRKQLPKKKNLNLFNGVNIFQNFLGNNSNKMLPSLQRPSAELRVRLEPLEKTELWNSSDYFQSAVHNEYENFRKTVIEQAMMKVFNGVNDGPIVSMFRELHENLTPASTTVKTTRKRKAEEESVRSSVRQSECAFRYKEIVVRKHENYIQVVLVPNNNKQNSLTIEAMKELKEAFLSAKKDPNCRAVLLNSSGSFFCSGLDLSQLMGPNKKQVAEEMAVTLRDLIMTLGLFTKPVVAAVNGAAIGFGVSLLTFCDIVLASDKATFCIPAARLGYVPEGAVTLTLPQVVGSGVAIEMLLQGRRLTAQQALRYGLVSEVLWPTQLMEEVIPRVHLLVAQPLQVMEAIKTMVRCHLWEKLALHAQQEWKLLPSQWLDQSCQHNIKKLQQTGWSSE